jgi:hypothetical protein
MTVSERSFVLRARYRDWLGRPVGALASHLHRRVEVGAEPQRTYDLNLPTVRWMEGD